MPGIIVKRILVSQRIFKAESYQEQREALASDWGEFLSSLGFLPIPLLSGIELQRYFDLDIDGILLTGGNDLSQIDNNDCNCKRDKLEGALLQHGMDRSLPVFGVCRGMQFLASYFGSTFSAITDHVRERHSLLSVGDSTYASFVSGRESVNSYHAYAIDQLAPELEVFAKSEDGCIEGMYHPSHFIAGTMWHPEREKPFDSSDVHLLREFFEKGTL